MTGRVLNDQPRRVAHELVDFPGRGQRCNGVGRVADDEHRLLERRVPGSGETKAGRRVHPLGPELALAIGFDEADAAAEMRADLAQDADYLVRHALGRDAVLAPDRRRVGAADGDARELRLARAGVDARVRVLEEREGVVVKDRLGEQGGDGGPRTGSVGRLVQAR